MPGQEAVNGGGQVAVGARASEEVGKEPPEMIRSVASACPAQFCCSGSAARATGRQCETELARV